MMGAICYMLPGTRAFNDIVVTLATSSGNSSNSSLSWLMFVNVSISARFFVEFSYAGDGLVCLRASLRWEVGTDVLDKFCYDVPFRSFFYALTKHFFT